MKKILVAFGLLALIAMTGCSAYDVNYIDGPTYQSVSSKEAALYGLTPSSVTGESYATYVENFYYSSASMPISTFSTDVDTASYANIRRMINQEISPLASAVRIEEMVNYFSYDLPTPEDAEHPIRVTTVLSDAPWNSAHQLLMVGLKTQEIEYNTTSPNNYVFLLDVSGSMASADKLPLLKDAIRMLTDELRPLDTISLVVYAGAAGVVLDGGDLTDKDAIYEAIDNLSAGGSTAGGQGIELAYQIAQSHFVEGGNNRVILGTDGDFNVGISNLDDLKDFIAEKRDTGIYLSVLGFGTGNLRDDVLESLADNGNGNYSYIDCVQEAHKVLVEEMTGTMLTVAEDVKLQLEFNPALVKGYRLIGYENRLLSVEDFDDDEVDAGDIGAGTEVIAFYEIVPADSQETVDDIDATLPSDLRYDGTNFMDELMTVSIRYKLPQEDESRLFVHTAYATDYTSNPGETFNFAASVVMFGFLLIDSQYMGSTSYELCLQVANANKGQDEGGYRAEFIALVEVARILAS
ncbi:MAG: VWA domain-containing protein [Candidatus Izemoplasmatales bacterium]|nr:VWA domain-containing protein [Candidatus Izemoplasmatales bacterium]